MMTDADFIAASQEPEWDLSKALHYAKGEFQDRGLTPEGLVEKFPDFAQFLKDYQEHIGAASEQGLLEQELHSSREDSNSAASGANEQQHLNELVSQTKEAEADYPRLDSPQQWISRMLAYCPDMEIRREWFALYPEAVSSACRPYLYAELFDRKPDHGEFIRAYTRNTDAPLGLLTRYAFMLPENGSPDRWKKARQLMREAAKRLPVRVADDTELDTKLVSTREFFDDFPKGYVLDEFCAQWVAWGKNHAELLAWLADDPWLVRQTYRDAELRRVLQQCKRLSANAERLSVRALSRASGISRPKITAMAHEDKLPQEVANRLKT